MKCPRPRNKGNGSRLGLLTETRCQIRNNFAPRLAEGRPVAIAFETNNRSITSVTIGLNSLNEKIVILMRASTIANARAVFAPAWQKIRSHSSRVPAKAWVVIALFFIAAIAMALHTALSEKDSTLRLKVQHSFRSAQISVWVDGDLSYSGKLTGSIKKKFGLFSESIQGSLSQAIPVSSGKHSIRVQVTGDDGSSQQDSTNVEFASKGDRTLSVSARHSDLSLTWQGGSVAAVDSGGSGWFTRYANALLLTIAGSIISALAGFAVKEVPGYIKSRPEAAPKAESASAGQ